MKKLKAGEFCEIAEIASIEGMPEWANLTSRVKSSPEMVGAGIYACFWDGDLIYVGLHVGPEENPFGASVAERLHKHILGFTLRSNRLSFSKSGLKAILSELTDGSGERSVIADELSVLEPAIVTKDKGLSSTFNKARFAALHWEELADAAPSEIIRRFEAGFAKIDAINFDGLSKREIKALITRQFEKPTILEFGPCCNTAMRKSDGDTVGFGEVTDYIDRLIADWPGSSSNRIEATIVQARRDAAQVDDTNNQDADEETGTILGPDARYFEYKTEKGQWRVKSSAADRVLAVGLSATSVSCLATPARLKAFGVDACETSPSETTMNSLVKVDPMACDGSYENLLRSIVEASLAELELLTFSKV